MGCRPAAGLGLLAMLVVGTAPAHAGDPDRVWHTIESAHFVIHYYDPLEPVARRVAVVGEHAHRALSVALDHVPDVKTQILLVDDTDGANGFANVIPRNAITLFATAPTQNSNLGDFDDWLYDLVAHEYTHVLHLDTIAGLPRAYNAIFGKTWSPNQIQPRWVIEGLATYQESKRGSAGRARNATFDAYLRIPSLEGKALPLDQVTGGPLRFPRGNAAYLYGSGFLRWLFDRYGDDTARAMSHRHGRNPLPFAVNRQVEHVVGRPFTELYEDWLVHLRDRAALQQEAVARRGPRVGRRLTFSAESNVAPAYLPDGQLLWVQADGTSRPRIRAIPPGGDVDHAKDLVAIDRMGGYSPLADGSIVFEQSDVYRVQYSFQDLLWWDRTTGRTVRLTRGQRTRDPAVSPDQRWVAFSQNGGGESTLGIMPLAPEGELKTLWRGKPFEQAYAPAWSPDGKRLAFVGWRSGGYRDILVLDVATGALEEVAHDRALDGDPVWSPDGRWLYFVSDRTGIFNVFACEWPSRTIWQVTDVIGGAFEPAVSPDGQRLAYHGLVPDGTDLFELAIDPQSWPLAAPYVDDRPPPPQISDDSVEVSAPRSYRARETLAPGNYRARLAQDSFGQTGVVDVNGGDMAGLHGYQLIGSLGFERKNLAVGGSYGYGGSRFGLRVSAARSLVLRGGYRVDGLNRTYLEEQIGTAISVGIPTQRGAVGSWNLSFDYDVDWLRLVDDPVKMLDPNQAVPIRPITDAVLAGVAARLSFGDVRGFALGLGPQEGKDLAVSFRYDHPALGSTAKSLAVAWSARTFWKLPYGETPTLALRWVGGIRVGDLPRPGFFALGGIPDQDVVQAILDSTRTGNTGYLRGYPSRTVAGRTYQLVNLEYRHALWNIERGLGTLPFYLRRLHLAVLSDSGTAYEDDLSTDDLRTSLGAALRLDTVFGYFVPGAFELGVSRGLVNGGITQSWFVLAGTF